MFDKINLQRFAEDKPEPKGEEKEPKGQEKKTENEEQITMKKTEYEKSLQVEADKRVNQALKTAQEKWEKEFREKVQEERREAERLAKLSAEERQKELEQRQKEELSSREREINRKEMKLEAINILADKKLPVKFSDILIGLTAEETQNRIKDFEKAFREEVEAEVMIRLKGTSPKSGTEEQKKKGYSMNDLIRGSVKRK